MSASLLICDDGHETIVYVGNPCPLCQANSEIERLKEDLDKIPYPPIKLSPEQKKSIKNRIETELKKYRQADWMDDKLLSEDIGRKIIHTLENDYQK